MRKPLHVQIVETRLSLQRAKPRSIRHAELELRLRDFVSAQLKFENRLDKKRSHKAIIENNGDHSRLSVHA